MTNQETVSSVPLLDLKRQYAPIKEAVMAAIAEVVDSTQFIQGPKVEELEQQIADYCGTKHAIGVSSGTDALVLSLMALGIGPGDEVITTPFTFFATAGSISRVGATPVFVDIDPDTFNIDASQIESKITDKTKAIIPVHLFGQMADMAPIMEIAKAKGLYVIEDAAQAIGSKTLYNGKMAAAGSIGDLGCFSFFPSKNLGACGDGGIITTNDDELAERCRVMRVHGSKPKYIHHVIGGNFRLDPIHAAVLSVKLPYLDDQHEGRRRNAEFYNKNLHSAIVTPIVKDDNYMIYNQYTIRVADREALMTTLQEKNIGHMIYYPIPMHLQACFSDLGHKEGDFPEAEKAAKEVLSIPVFPDLSQDELDYVVSTINSDTTVTG